MNSPRKDALLVLIDVIEGGAYANLRLKEVHQSEQELSFVTSIVYTTLEHFFWADYILSFYVKPQKKTVRNILRMALTELFFMDTPDHAAVHEAVALAYSCGKGTSANVINGVLRHIIRERGSLPPLPESLSERLSIQHSCPKWIITKLLAQYGPDQTEQMLAYRAPAMEIRAHFPFRDEQLKEQLSVPYTLGQVDKHCFKLGKSLSLSNDPLFVSGKIAVQGEGAMAICRFMGDMRGKHVLDACAAPGGKSAYLWSLTQGDIDLCCYELHPHRIELMRKNFQRMAVKARIENRNAADPQLTEPAFDGILLDVPCSGLGLMGEKPDVAIKKTPQDIQAVCQEQAAILAGCAPLLFPGGVLCYSTCTILFEENQQQVRLFLASHPSFVLEEEQQLLPHRHHTGGFYMARMRRCI